MARDRRAGAAARAEGRPLSAPLHVFRARYTRAFDAWRRERSEAALHEAYELGRDGVESELSVLDLAAAHHDALRTALGGAPAAEHDDVVRAAEAFFAEALSAFEMVRRGFAEAQEAVRLERRHAAMLRQLSAFLADTSLTVQGADTLEEMLQLVAEEARELLDACACLAVLPASEGGHSVEATAHVDVGTGWEAPPQPANENPGPGGSTQSLFAPMRGLDGTYLGSIQLFGKRHGSFGELDHAVLRHVAQMAAAAVDRVRLYQRVR